MSPLARSFFPKFLNLGYGILGPIEFCVEFTILLDPCESSLIFHYGHSSNSTVRGSISLSPDKSLLAVNVVHDGFHMCSIESGLVLYHVLQDNIRSDRVLFSCFAHGGKAIVGGSASGAVQVWDAGDGTIFHVLEHPGVHAFDGVRMVIANS